MNAYQLAKVVLRPSTRFFFGARVCGEERVPETGGLVVAANHRSYLDPPVLGAWFPRMIHFMAKKELFAMPVVGPVITSWQAFPVDRERADLGAIRHALRILRDGGVVGIFPEGRRNLDGEAKARGGAVLLAATAKVPIVPVALVGTSVALRRFRRSGMEVRIGEPIVLQGSAGKPTKDEVDRWTSELSHTIDRLADIKNT